MKALNTEMQNPTGRQVINTETGEEGHVFGLAEIDCERIYWLRTQKASGFGWSGRSVSGKNLKKNDRNYIVDSRINCCAFYYHGCCSDPKR